VVFEFVDKVIGVFDVTVTFIGQMVEKVINILCNLIAFAATIKNTTRVGGLL